MKLEDVIYVYYDRPMDQVLNWLINNFVVFDRNFEGPKLRMTDPMV